MSFSNPPDDVIREILSHPRRIAVVGCSPDPRRDSNHIARLLRLFRSAETVPAGQ